MAYDYCVIPELMKAHGTLTTQKLTLMTEANLHTVRKHIQALVKSGHLLQHGKGRATWYTLS